MGATSGIGGTAVQLAWAACATVVAPGLPEGEEYLRMPDASDVLPRGGDLVAAVRRRHLGGVGALVDGVTAYEITPFAGVVKNGGRIVSPTCAAEYGPGRTDVVHGPCREILGRVARHLADGTITIPVGRTYAPVDAAVALQALATRHTRGKIALRVA